MESENYSINTHDRVRRLQELQDKVRALELRNDKLAPQQVTRNGLLENRPSVLSYLSDEDIYEKRFDLSLQSLDDNCLTPEEMDNEFLNDETWLNKTRGGVVDNSTSHDLIQWLRQDIDNRNDLEMQRLRRVLIQRIDEIERGLRRSSVDTRTFTRPKKRISRPSLETMSEAPCPENNLTLSPWQRLLATNVITENIDDISIKFESTFPSLSFDTSNLNTTFSKSHIMDFNSTFQKIASETQMNMSADTKLDVTFLKSDLENQELNALSHKSSDSDLSSSSRKASDPCINTTFLKTPGEVNSTTHTPSRSRSITPSGLNCTFAVVDSGHRSGRVPSCDSVVDDDQMSSASDSSFSSTTRLMNVGDVQNIARLQEESLRQLTSTPKRSQSREGVILNGDDALSPIKRSTQDLNYGYQSDHSDHSSVEGRVKSSRSSVRSSPAGSPFGSTMALTHDYPPSSNAAYGLPRRELKLIPPSQKQPVSRLQTAARPSVPNRGRPVSGIRPPAVRPSGISRPSSAGGSNIPRPQSRIPAPRFRSAQPATKVDWMDGCY